MYQHYHPAKIWFIVELVAASTLWLLLPINLWGQVYRFSADDNGKLPSGWIAARTAGPGNVWKVIMDRTAPSGKGYALAQIAAGPDRLFNICVLENTNYKDVEVIVAFKALRGKSDQGGGVVWRYQDPNNYYVARMNPLRSNYRVYKVIAGKRIQMAGEENITIPTCEWHKIKIVQDGNHLDCFLDGKKYLDADDTAITRSGKIGLWTKSDARTAFDEIHISGK